LNGLGLPACKDVDELQAQGVTESMPADQGGWFDDDQSAAPVEEAGELGHRESISRLLSARLLIYDPMLRKRTKVVRLTLMVPAMPDTMPALGVARLIGRYQDGA
jgi:hypothetical protein